MKATIDDNDNDLEHMFIIMMMVIIMSEMKVMQLMMLYVIIACKYNEYEWVWLILMSNFDEFVYDKKRIYLNIKQWILLFS